jgi:hypothetical protein
VLGSAQMEPGGLGVRDRRSNECHTDDCKT